MSECRCSTACWPQVQPCCAAAQPPPVLSARGLPCSTVCRVAVLVACVQLLTVQTVALNRKLHGPFAVFFGEALPRRFFESVPQDFPQVSAPMPHTRSSCCWCCTTEWRLRTRPAVEPRCSMHGMRGRHITTVTGTSWSTHGCHCCVATATQADLLIVMGSSLVVHPFASLIGTALLLSICLLRPVAE